MSDSHDADRPAVDHQSVASGDDANSASSVRVQTPTDRAYPETEANNESLPFQQLGHYEIRRHIGGGGMGDVYLGFEPDLDRLVAIKVLPTELARHDDFVRRFRAEAAAAAKLVHPNIIPIYFIGEDAGYHFFVMQYVHGHSLADVLAGTSQLPLEESLSIARQLLKGLSVAHQREMVHRDIKPGNILLDQESRRAILVDFGLVKSLQGSDGSSLTVTGTVMGTVDYIAPEQAQGKPIDGRADLYSLGAVLYRMLSGKLPFSADNATALIFQHVYETPERLDEVAGIPTVVADIVAKLLEKQPDDRYQSADAVIKDLEQVATRSSGAPETATSLVVAPAWTEPPEVDASFADKMPGHFGRLVDRVLAFGRDKTPVWVRNLESTEQQVDGAVVEYERRRDALAGPLAEAEAVVTELQRQKDNWLDAAGAAIQRADNAASPDAKQQAVEEAHEADRVASELQNQIDEQRQHLDVMQLRVTKVKATLEQLRSQRDLLSARLKAAQAKLKLGGARVESKSVRRRRLILGTAAAMGLVVLLGTAAVLLNGGDGERTSEIPNAPGQGSFDALENGNSRRAARTPTAFRVRVPSLVTSITFKPRRKDFRFATTDARGMANLYDIGKEPGFSWTRAYEVREERELRTMALSPLEEDAAIADDDFAIRIYQNGQQKCRLVGHSGEVLRLRFSSDGSHLYSVSQDGTLRIWDVVAESEVDQLTMPDDWDQGPVSWSANGQHLAFTARNGSTRVAWLYDLRARKTRHVGEFSNAHDDAQPFVSNSGQRVFVNSGGITAFNRQDETQTEFAEGAQRVAYSPATHRLLTTDGSEHVTLWDGKSGKILKRFSEHTRPVTAIAISVDGRIGLSAGQDGVMFRWDLPPIERRGNSLPTHKQAVTHVAFSRNGHQTFSCDTAGAFHAADIASGELTRKGVTVGSPVSDFVVTRDGKHGILATAADKSLVNQLSIKALSGRRTTRDLRGHRGPITDVALSANEQFVLSGSLDGTVRVWEYQSGNQVGRFDVDSPVQSIALVPGPNTVCAIGSDDRLIRFWDADNNVQRKELVGHDGAVLSLAFLETDLVSASDDHTIRVWERDASEPRLTLTGHWDAVNRVAVSSDGERIVSASDDGTARVWDARTGREVQQFADHDGRVLAVAISPDGQRVLSGDEFGTLALWNIEPQD